MWEPVHEAHGQPTRLDDQVLKGTLDAGPGELPWLARVLVYCHLSMPGSDTVLTRWDSKHGARTKPWHTAGIEYEGSESVCAEPCCLSRSVGLALHAERPPAWG